MNSLIDCNVGFGPWPFRRLRGTGLAPLLSRLEPIGIRRVVVASNEILHLAPGRANEKLAEVASRWRGRVRFVATINPVFPAWQEDFEQAVRRGAVAIRLLPRYHGYALSSSVAKEVVEACNEKGLPVFLPLRLGDERHQHPLCTVPPLKSEEVVEWLQSGSVPRRLVVQNGRFDELRKIAENDRGAVELYFDLSFVNGPDGALEELVELVSARRLLFGTQAPLQYPEPKVEQLLTADLSPEDKATIGWRNAAYLFFAEVAEKVPSP